MKKHYLSRLGLPPLELVPGETFTIGRDPTCTLPVPSEKVSRLHAEIRWKDGEPLLVDLGSVNGTVVSNRRVAEQRLVAGDEIQIGPLVAVYQLSDKAPRPLGNTARMSETMGAPGASLSGQIEAAGLAEVLQGLELNAKTGTLNAYDRTIRGWITVDAGVPGAAAVDVAGAPSESRVDLEAVIFLLGMKQGLFVLDPGLKVAEKRMSVTMTAILLEWSRRAAQVPG